MHLASLFLVFTLLNQSDNKPKEQPSYLTVVDVKRNSWRSRKFYESKAVVYIAEVDHKRKLCWEEYDQSDGELISRVWCDAEGLILTDEKQKKVFKWGIKDLDRMFPQISFTGGGVYQNFEISNENMSQRWFLPNGMIKKEEALIQYDPSKISVKSELSEYDVRILTDEYLFIHGKLDESLIKALLLKGGIDSLKVLEGLKVKLSADFISEVENQINTNIQELGASIDKIITSLEESLSNPEQSVQKKLVFVTPETMAFLKSNSTSTFYILKKKLFELFHDRINKESEEYVKKNEKETVLESFLQLFDPDNKRRITLRPKLASKLEKSVNEIVFHLSNITGLTTYFDMKWSFGSSVFSSHLYLEHTDFNLLRKIAEIKSTVPVLSEYEEINGLSAVDSAQDIFQEFQIKVDTDLRIVGVTTDTNKQNTSTSIELSSNLADQAVISVKIFKYILDYYAKTEGDGYFARYKTPVIDIKKVSIAFQKGIVELKDIQPSLYNVIFELISGDQVEQAVIEKLGDIYMDKLLYSDILVPCTEQFVEILSEEFEQYISRLNEIYLDLKKISENSKLYDDEVSRSKLTDKYMTLLSELDKNIKILSASHGFLRSSLEKIFETYNNADVFKKNMYQEGKYKPGQPNTSDYMYHIQDIFSRINGVIIRETFLYIISAYSIQMDKAKNVVSLLQDTVENIIKQIKVLDGYEYYYKKYFVLVLDDNKGEMDFTEQYKVLLKDGIDGSTEVLFKELELKMLNGASN
ncbi:MAG: hypothetical protein HY606_00460 [Planctomycetes bacterium]|nr:hypothetical protein [Planctomycetota bacterium]